MPVRGSEPGYEAGIHTGRLPSIMVSHFMIAPLFSALLAMPSTKNYEYCDVLCNYSLTFVVSTCGLVLALFLGPHPQLSHYNLKVEA